MGSGVSGIKNKNISLNAINGENFISAANFTSNSARDIMSIPVETATTKANPRTEKQLERSDKLMALKNSMDNAPVGTSFGMTYDNGKTVVFEKVTIGNRDTGWERTELHTDGGVSYGGGIPKNTTPQFIGTINTIRSVTSPISESDMNRYRNFRRSTDISWKF